MQEPNCKKCRTDRYLKHTKLEEGHTKRQSFGTLQGATGHSQWVSPIAQFFCQACGTSGRVTVPDDWRPPSADPEIADLKQKGEFWTSPNDQHVRQENGAWVQRVMG